MAVILESKRFDIVLAETGYEGGHNKYALRYGAEVTTHSFLVDSVRAFQSALEHALTCEGYLAPPEE